MARASDPSFQFWFDEKFYTVQGAETMARMATPDDMLTMRAEYTRMRDVAQKRLHRLEKQFPESKASKHFYDTGKRDAKGDPIMALGFQKLKNIDPRDFPKAFAELAKFVRAKGSTVSGQKSIKQKTMKTWQEQGLNLNPKNYDKTIKVLERMRQSKIVYGSDKVVELADYMLELNDQQTNAWLDHLETLMEHQQELDMWKDIYESRGEPVNIDDLLREIGW